MRLPAKIGLGVGVVAVAYLLLLLIAGMVAGSVVASKVRDRLRDGFDAKVEVGGADVNLVTGSVVVKDVQLTRDVVDHLGLTVHRLEVDVAPAGLVLFDREPRHVAVEGGRLVITGAGALQLPRRPDRPPIRVGALDIDDFALDLMATGYWAGLARIVITIERARSGETTLRTGLSWIFTLDELAATVELPAGMVVKITYRDHQLAASGGFFGATPVSIPFTLPPLDGANEVKQLVAIGEELGKRLAVERARRWLGAKLLSP